MSVPINVKNKKLYAKISEEVKQNYKHSLYRSALIQKKYKEAGGEYNKKSNPKSSINKWFSEKWIAVTPYVSNTPPKIVKCGSMEGKNKACRPLIKKENTPITIKEVIKKHGKEKVKQLAKLKDVENVRINWEAGKPYKKKEKKKTK